MSPPLIVEFRLSWRIALFRRDRRIDDAREALHNPSAFIFLGKNFRLLLASQVEPVVMGWSQFGGWEFPI
jgi:hypothetical protein